MATFIAVASFSPETDLPLMTTVEMLPIAHSWEMEVYPTPVRPDQRD